MSNRRVRHVRLSKPTLEHLHSDLCRLAEDFSLRLLDTIAKSPVREFPVPRARRKRRGEPMN